VKQAVVCSVQSRDRAEAIVSELSRAGFSNDDISLLGAVVNTAVSGSRGGRHTALPGIEASRFERTLKSGHVLISVQAERSEEVRCAEQIFRAAGADDIGITTSISFPKVAAAAHART
jgi:phage replication-related protein YjqB (UPF0714/DUF867 family)